ncbi:MAG: hypothetical protein IPM36_04510 [Lewinellaceae bacterium]|nr:hypothetical protein [Lewinellaceae bacterium]
MDDATGKGPTPSNAAYQILRAIPKRERRGLVWRKKKCWVFISNVFPGFFSKLIKRRKKLPIKSNFCCGQ